MKRISIITGLLCCQFFVRAQGGKFQIGIGYQRTWMVDQQASPLKYQSSQKTLLIGYEHTGPGGKISATVEGAMGSFFPEGHAGRVWYNSAYNNDGTPKTDSFSLRGKLYNARIKLGYLAALPSGYSKLGKNNIYTNDYLGGSLSNQLFYSDNIVRAGWLNSTSLNADYEHAILFNTQHSVSIRVSIPLFARNSRLPYHNTISSENGEGNVKTFFKRGSRLTSVIDFQNMQIDATYEYALSKMMGIGIHYFGQWMHYSYEQPITLFQNNIGIMASLK